MYRRTRICRLLVVVSLGVSLIVLKISHNARAVSGQGNDELGVVDKAIPSFEHEVDKGSRDSGRTVEKAAPVPKYKIDNAGPLPEHKLDNASQDSKHRVVAKPSKTLIKITDIKMDRPTVSFSQALTSRVNSKGEIILATVDYGYIEMAINFYESSLKKFGLNNYLFVTSGSQAGAVFDQHGIAYFKYFDDKDASQPRDFTQHAFARKTHYKTKMVLAALKLGYTVLLTDVDIVFLKDPFPFLDCASCDLQISSDVVEVNSGFYLVRPTKAAIELFQRTWNGSMSNPQVTEQKQMDSVLGSMVKDKAINHTMLNLKTFPCGLTYFELNHRMFAGDKPCTDCVIVHNNWIVSKQAKVYRFKEHLMWYVDEGGYYTDPSRKYLTYGNPLDWEKDNLKMETQALKTALSIGYILNRTVILPAFHCRNRVHCPLSAYYKISVFDKAFGGVYREHMFLQKDSVPDSVKKSLSDVIVIDDPIATNSSDPGKDCVHFTPSQPDRGVTRDELLSWLAGQQYSQISVLRLHALYGNMASFLDGESQAVFQEKLESAFKRADSRQFDIYI